MTIIFKTYEQKYFNTCYCYNLYISIFLLTYVKVFQKHAEHKMRNKIISLFIFYK